MAIGGAAGASGDLYVTSPASDEVLQFDITTGNLVGSFITTGAGGLDLPTGLAFGPNGNLFVLSQGTDAIGDDSILEFDGSTGAFLGVFHPGSSQTLWNENGAGELTWGSNGNLFVSNWVDQSGSLSFLFLPEAYELNGADGSIVQIYQSFETCVWRPHALAIAGTNKIYLSSRNAPWQDIYAYNSTTGACDSPAVTAPFTLIGQVSDGIEFGPNGNLFVTRRDSNDVLEVDGVSGNLVRTLITPGSGGLDTPGDLKFGPNGNLFVVNVDGQIFEYDGADGSFVRVFSTLPLAGSQGDGIGRVHLAFKPPIRVIEIDISPFSEGNRLHLGSRQRVIVALLGSGDFDVSRVDVQTLAFGPDGSRSTPGPPPPPEAMPRTVDVNRDGFVDLLAMFDVAATGIPADATEACLTGDLLDGRPFEGCDAVQVVPPRGAQP